MAGLLIFARLLCGETVPLEVTPDATVADVLTALQAARPARHRRQLTFQGTELRDVRVALADVGCGMQAVVHESAARVSDFSFAPELCCPQLEVRSEGKSLWKLRGYSWATCCMHPPLELGMEGTVHLKLNCSELSTFDAAGIMEYTEAAGVEGRIRTENNSEIMAAAERWLRRHLRRHSSRRYYWDLAWNTLVDTEGQRTTGLPHPQIGHVITLQASIRPGGQLSITAHDGSTSNVPIRFQREGGTASQDSKYAFFVTVNSPSGGVDIVDEGSGNPPFDVSQCRDDIYGIDDTRVECDAGSQEEPAAPEAEAVQGTNAPHLAEKDDSGSVGSGSCGSDLAPPVSAG
eukprot:TRINITY_DN4679_c0_g1_i1.p1 TRINITY_DN4679_c0_g1~~TRINITY_DN4679_c0_g1_i1.p1  ORF type:complete len:347 (+),score=71.35 TRINITY_DN4679_c0_g1_i1:55-1095(+)